MIRQSEKFDYVWDITELVIGDIKSVGETEHDKRALDNLEVYSDVMLQMLTEICNECYVTNESFEDSKQKSHKLSKQKIYEAKEKIEELLNEISKNKLI